MRPAYSQFWVAIAAVLTLAAPKGAATQLDQVAGTEVDLAIGIEPRLISSTPSIFTNDDADTLLARATSRLAMKNDHSACSDFTVCLNLVPSSHVELPADLPDILVFNDDDEAGAWLSQHFNPAIKVVGAISIKNSPVEGFSNGGASPSMVIAVFSSSTSSLRVTASTWAHEFCHTAGLAEVTGDSYCDYNIMKDQSSQRDPDQLTLTQVTTMESNVPSMPVAKAATVECQPTSVAGLENIRARLGPDGVVVSFGTIWEAYTAAFEIQRMDAESGAILYSLGTASEIPSQAERSYAALDRNGGSGCVYRIVEHQTDGRGDLYHGPVFAEPAPALLPVGTSPYAVDSLAAVVLSYDRGPSDPPPSPCSNHDLLNGTPEYELLCPDSFVTPLNSYASLWRQRGVYTWVVSKTIADSCAGGFREWIRYAASKGTRYFLLVGDANDHVMWDEPANWRMGWRFPGVYNSPSQTTLITHTPSQPNKDIIPTFYQAVVDSPQYAWTYYTPYFASDLPYTDADDDGLPDVIVGRLPASSVAEVTAYTGKLAGWLSSTGGTLGATAALFTYAVNHGRTPAWPTAFAVDALRPAMVSASVLQAGYFHFGRPTWGSLVRDSIQAIANAAASGGADLITWNLNSSDRYENTGYWKIEANGQQLPIGGTSRAFVSVGLSCDMNDFDQTEEYKDIEGSDQAGYTFSEPLKPLVERLLFMPNGGAICQIGPTRASFMEGNAEIGKTFLARLYEQGNSVGRAFLLAQRACMLRLPQYRDLFRSYVLLGDPRLGPTTITGVMPSQSALRGRLMPAVPNPFNPRTILRYYIATRGPVFVTIFDVQGRVVRRLLRLSSRPAGWGAVEWNGRDDAGRTVATGVYFARLLAGGVRETQRLVLLK